MTGHWLNPRFADPVAKRSFVHSAALALVWLTMATSGIVFSEPCPTDILTMGLIILLPTIGLVRFGPELSFLLLGWVITAACGLVAATAAIDMTGAVKHMVVSLFLSGAAVIIAGFIAARPEAHLKLIFNGLTAGAILAATTGVLGYFGLIPGAELFTKFGRATGTFKDPNVFGPFLVPPFLYMVHIALHRPLKRSIGPFALAGLFAIAIFLSFSRGAWMSLIVALAVYLAFAFQAAKSLAQQRRIAFLPLLGAGLLAAMLVGVTQIDSVNDLMSQRASVTQDYDVGPDGRFGGQQKAIALILENPIGIGAGQFTQFFHHEEPHNVYLSMLLNAGWIGGAVYAIMMALTLLVGFTSAMRRSPVQHFQFIAVAALLANVAEGAIIDTDHWRHIYLLMAIVWGIATAPEVAPAKALLLRARIRVRRAAMA